MIVVQTPLRVSFFGGGTDFETFSSREGGCVLSSAIDRYIYVVIKERYDDRIRVGYSRTELVDSMQDLEHELVRESLRMTDLRRGVEISTMADIPSRGSGLGSSSAVTVGLLNAMYHYQCEPSDRETLAQQACQIEIDILGKPIGKQDQYIAAYGGQRLIEFKPCGGVDVTTPQVSKETWQRLSDRLLLFFTGVTRKADTVLKEQEDNMLDRLSFLREIKNLAYKGVEALAAGEIDDFGRLLNQGWALKKQLASRISNDALDDMYCKALKAGAIGGKIAGAGGGGFLLLYAPMERHDHIRTALGHLTEMRFNLAPEGSKVILNYRR
ncbi:MAG: GHMP kinase [Bryobacterales bacterium]|nr:GHMP kinase [Acidobacteriota bacterium]MCB9384646.1 GHMP kinase [Bryobacterales bacterium]